MSFIEGSSRERRLSDQGMLASPDLPTEATDLELVARCRAGDRHATRELYDRHFAIVQRLARRLGAPPAEIDDVTQDVFARAFSRLDQFKAGNFGDWIRRICANAVTDLHRSHRVRRTFAALTFRRSAEEADLGPGPEAQVGQREAEGQVGIILSRMRPKQREVFILFELESLSGEEIAAMIGCPVNTVWTRLFHARKAFVRIGRKRGFVVETP
jgi:RNA polymerase sigma-70 factor (ECF subfamily)